MEASTFTLRRLEMAMPYLTAAENQDPKALVSLAAISMADDSSLKLIAAGSTETLAVFQEKAYGLPADEVASLLANFIQGSARFKLCLDGLDPEEVNQVMAMAMKKTRAEKGLASPAESRKSQAASKQP